MGSILKDLSFAFRSLRKSPFLTLVAAFSLAIGIGANGAIFSAVDVFMIRPLPFPDSQELGFIWTTNQERGWTSVSNSLLDVWDWREEARSMELAAYRGTGVNLSSGDVPERLSGYLIGWNFLNVLGISPVEGRSFSPEEETDGGAKVALLGHGIWERVFGSDPTLMGRTILLDGDAYTVTGILPPRFRFGYNEPEILLPLGIADDEQRDWHYVRTLARIREGYTPEQANTELDQLQGRIARAFPETSAGNGARFLSMREEWFDEGFREGSLISTVAVLFVLLIACANVANLLLARGAGREAEVALREALGAGKSRIVRQLLTESLLLAISGGILGLFLAVLGIKGLVAVMPPDFMLVEEIRLNGRVLAFTGGVTLVAGILFGLAPALQTASPDLKGALHEGARGSTGARGGALRKGLVVTEVALAMVLLVSSSLLVQSFWRLRSMDLGFQPQGLLTMEMDLPEARYPGPQELGVFQRDLLDRIQALPGVEMAALTTVLPTQGHQSVFYSIPNLDLPSEDRRPVVGVRTVSPDYFATMEIPLVRGRGFTPGDDANAPSVLVVNEAFANQHWPDSDPLGEEVAFQGTEGEIVGVVGDVRVFGPSDEAPALIYFSAFAGAERGPSLAIRTTGEPLAMADEVRDVVRSVDPDQPVYSVASMETVLRDSTGGETIMAKIMGVLALVALVLALVGVYGVMAYTVSRRTHEMGIRMALGADSGSVMFLVLRQGATLAGLGVGIGLVLSLAVTRGLSFFLFGVSPFDLPIFGGVATLLLGASVLATLLPARKATRVDPLIALRSE